MEDKTKEQLLEELSETQKMFEARTEAQGQMIKKIQALFADEGLFSQIIDFMPYPLAIFIPQYTLVMVNKAFAAETKTRLVHLEKSPARILPYKIDNVQLAAAITQVFTGDTFFLEDLKNPLSMFSGIKRVQRTDRYTRVVIFPIPTDGDKISHGVIMFMP